MKAVIYTHKSNGNVWDKSIAHQRRICLDFAKEHGIEIVGIYEDDVHTMHLKGRVEFQRLMSNLKHGTIQFDLLLVSSFQHLTRDRREWYRYSDVLKKHGISVESVLEQPDDEQRQSNMQIKELLLLAQAYHLSEEKRRKK